MKVTKFTHACLWIQEGESSVIVDPGHWSWQDGQVELGVISKLDAIVITHNHADHCSADFIKALLTQFPTAKVIGNEEVVDTIKQAGIDADFLPSLPEVVPFEAAHAALPTGQVPLNTGFHLSGRLSHPGDSLDFNDAKPILALPYQAPWGSAAEAIELVRRLKPQMVLPIHDWHLSREGRDWYANFMTTVLSAEGIEFVALRDGEALEL